jgi:RimJ/RimL family protein N-acetyltransferase
VAYVESNPAGVFIVHPDSGCSYQLHANMLKQYRKEYSRQAVSMAIDFAFQNTGTRKINANIPAIYPNVIKCAEDCGFVHEGVRSSSYMKNSKAVDVVLMGVTR